MPAFSVAQPASEADDSVARSTRRCATRGHPGITSRKVGNTLHYVAGDIPSSEAFYEALEQSNNNPVHLSEWATEVRLLQRPCHQRGKL